MAEDFLPVGVRAVVENVDNFIADLGRMERAVRQFGQAVRDTGADVTVFGRSTRQAEQESRGFDAMLLRLRQNEEAFGATTQRLSTTIQSLIASLRGQQPAMDSFTASMQRARQAQETSRGSLLRQITSLDIFRNKIIQLQNNLDRQRGQLDQVSGSYRRAAQETGRLGQRVQALQERLSRERNTLGALNGSLAQATRAHAAAKKELDVLNKEIQRHTQFGASAIQIAQQFGAKQIELEDRVRQTTGEMHNFNIAILSSKDRLAALQGALQQVSGQYAQAASGAGILGHGMKILYGQIGKTQMGITALSAALLGIGAAAKIAKGAFNLLRTAILGVTKAIGLANTLFVGFFGVIKGVNARVENAAKKMFRWGNSIRFLGTSLTFMISLPIIGFMGSLTKSAIDFEEAWAGVVKTVDSSNFKILQEGSTNVRELTREGELLQKRIRDMALEMPIAATELAKIGEVAGTLGIRGVNNLDQFIETTAKLGVTTDVASEDAARSFAKILNISGLLSDAELALKGFTEEEIESMTTSQRFQHTVEGLGGVLVDLGNKTPAIESTMLDMAKQMAATSNVVGVTTAQTFALASAFDSSGATAVRAKTTYQRVMFDMLTATQEGGLSLEIFAKTAGETTEDFVTLFREDAAQAFLQFTQGLNAQGDDAVRTLQALDLADNRVMQTILSLAGAEGTLQDALELTTEELEAQAGGLNALETEAAKRFSTVQSQITILKNTFTELGIIVGEVVLPEILKLVGFIKNLIEQVSQLDPNLIKLILTLGLVVAAIGPVIAMIGLGMATFGLIIGAIASFVGAILSIVTTLGLLAVPILGVIAAVVGLAIAFAAAAGKMESFADITSKNIASKMFEFGKGIIIAFARGMAKAMAAIVVVLNAIGQLIAKWLKPGSPPKLLPDLDKWGENAMLSYMEGWASADFGIFNKIADKIEGFMRSIGEDAMPKDSLVSRILGTRKEIAKVIGEIKKVGQVTQGMLDRVYKAMGGTSKRAGEYVRALLAVAAASAKVAMAQKELEEINNRYAASLRPISARLKEITRRQEEVADAMRIGELEAILADPKAPELVRELARLELEQIQLEADTRSLEDAKDIELERAEAKLIAAEAEMEAAEEQLAVSEAMLDIQTKNNQLVNEMIQAVEKLGSKMGELTAGDIAPGFDSDAIEIPTEEDLFEDLDFSELETSVDEAIAGINTEFQGLVTELSEIFAPLGPLWDELGTTWAPIFDKLRGWLEDILPAGENAAESVETWIGKVRVFAEDLTGFIEGVFAEFMSILVDLGIIEPFGPLVSKAEEAEGPLSKLGQGVESVKNFFVELWDSFTDIPLVNFIFAQWGSTIEGLKGPLETLIDGLKNFWGSLTRVAAKIKEVWDRSTGLRKAIGAIVKVIIAIAGAIISFLNGLAVGALGAIMGAIGNFLSGVGVVFEALVSIIGGVVEVISAIVGFVVGMLQAMFGRNEEAMQSFRDAWESLKNGIINIVMGLVQGIIGLFMTVIGTVWGAISGFVEGIVNFFKDLFNRLIGHSIVTDLVNGILDLFKWLFVELPLKLAEFVLNFIGQIAQFVIDVLASIGTFVTDVIEFFGNLFIDIIEKVAQFVVDAIAFFIQLPFDILEKLGVLPEGIGEVVDDVVEWFTNLADDIIGTLIGLPGELFNLGVDMIQGLIDGVAGLAGDAVDSVVGVGEDILGGIGDFFGISSPSKEMEDIGEDVMGGWIRGVESQAKALLRIFVDMTDAVLEIVVHALTDMVKFWADILDEIIPITVAWMNSVIIAFTELSDTLVTGGANSIMYEFLKAMTLMWGQMVEDTIDYFITPMQILLSEFFEQTLQMLEDYRDEYYSAGQNLMSSLQAGIEAGAQGVYAAAQAVADEVKRIMDAAFEHGSPSKVFIRYGAEQMEGWAIGIESAGDQVYNAVARIAGGISQQASPVPASQLTSQQAVMPAVAPASASTITNATVEMGGQVINNGIDTVMLQIVLEQALRNVLE